MMKMTMKEKEATGNSSSTRSSPSVFCLLSVFAQLAMTSHQWMMLSALTIGAGIKWQTAVSKAANDTDGCTVACVFG